MVDVNDIAGEMLERLRTCSDNLDDNLHLSLDDQALMHGAILRIHKLENLLTKRNHHLLKIQKDLEELQKLLSTGEEHE